MAARSCGRLAPLTSSATTTGGSTTSPCARASSSEGVGTPAKKSIQTDVSATTPLTGHLEVDVEVELSTERHGLLIGSGAPDESKSLDEGVGDPPAGHSHRVTQKIGGGGWGWGPRPGPRGGPTTGGSYERTTARFTTPPPTT